MSHHIVLHSTARMPRSCFGRYRHVAVLEVDTADTAPKMISTRARSVRNVVRTWRNVNVGKTDRCAFRRALAEAHAVAAVLNDIAVDTDSKLKARTGCEATIACSDCVNVRYCNTHFGSDIND